MTVFSQAMRIPGTTGRDAEAPHIAASGSNVYLVWHKRPTPPPATDEDARLTMSSGRVVVTWRQPFLHAGAVNPDNEVFFVPGH